MDHRQQQAERARQVDENESQMGSIREIMQKPEDSKLLAALLKRDGQDGLAQRLLNAKLDYDTDIDDLHDYRQEMLSVREATKDVKEMIDSKKIKNMALLSEEAGDNNLQKICGFSGYDEVGEVIKSQIELIYVSDESHFDDIKDALEALKTREETGDERVKQIKEVCKEYDARKSDVDLVAQIPDEDRRRKAFGILIDPETDNEGLLKALREKDLSLRDWAVDALDDPKDRDLPSWIHWKKKKAEQATQSKISEGVSAFEEQRDLYGDEIEDINEALESMGGILGQSVDNENVRDALDVVLGGKNAKESLRDRTASAKDIAKAMPDTDDLYGDWDDYKTKNDLANKTPAEQIDLQDQFVKDQKNKVKPKGKKSLGFFGEMAQIIAEARSRQAMFDRPV